MAYRWYNVEELNEIFWIMKTLWGQVLKISKNGFILFGNNWRDSLLNSDYLGVFRKVVSPPTPTVKSSGTVCEIISGWPDLALWLRALLPFPVQQPQAPPPRFPRD